MLGLHVRFILRKGQPVNLCGAMLRARRDASLEDARSRYSVVIRAASRHLVKGYRLSGQLESKCFRKHLILPTHSKILLCESLLKPQAA